MTSNNLTNLFTDLASALHATYGNDIPTSLSNVAMHVLDGGFLCQIPEEYCHTEDDDNPFEIWEKETRTVPHVFIIWKNGRVEKVDQTSFRRDHTCHGTSFMVDDSTTRQVEADQSTASPIAAHFTQSDDVRRIILVRERYVRERFDRDPALKKIEELTVDIYTPDGSVDIKSESQKIMNIWESEGERGLDDYRYGIYWDDDA